MLELLGALDVVLGGQLAQLVDRLRLEVGEVQAVLVRIGREGTGEDGRVLPRRVVVAAALAEPALVPTLTARGVVGAASRPATLLLGPCVVVHGRLACQRWFIGGSDLDVLGAPSCPAESRRQDRQLGDDLRANTTAGRQWGSGSRAVNDQTLRVPARVVMLGPPYPLISPMSRVRI